MLGKFISLLESKFDNITFQHPREMIEDYADQIQIHCILPYQHPIFQFCVDVRLQECLSFNIKLELSVSNDRIKNHHCI